MRRRSAERRTSAFPTTAFQWFGRGRAAIVAAILSAAITPSPVNAAETTSASATVAEPPGPPVDRTSIDARVAAARAFLDALDPEMRRRAAGARSAADRDRWSYLPGPRPGVRLEELDADQRAHWRRFLACTLSDAGQARTDRIRATEPVENRGGGVFTGPDVYAIRFFGLDHEPGVRPRAWSWRLEGHHLRMGETIVDDRIVAATPFMLGSVRRRDAAGEVFAVEDEAATRLLAAVSEDRRETAWIPGPVPGDLRTAMQPPSRWRLEGGLPLGEIGGDARSIADALVEGLLRLRPKETVASLREAWSTTPDESIRFLWVGDADRTGTHQWRLVSPTLVIEFSHSGGDADHGHLVLRRPEGEFPDLDGAWTDEP